ncbi:hypothetical protein [Novosphingobium aureum]|uniref:hypothetical protein n=1 Tax=Novosphingobium aureum TaxID=2792964 RepID=UPI0018CE086E|nr:hypothetical protein [Novosphingobium aureum]
MVLGLCALLGVLSISGPASAVQRDYEALLELFERWRAFAAPEASDSAPDYSASAMAQKARALPDFQRELAALDMQGWSLVQRNDARLVGAEMAGLDFDLRVLRPFARDPAFYVTLWPHQTDVPSREARAALPRIELYAFTFPLSPQDDSLLARRFEAVAPLLRQARINLADSNARDLWVYGITAVEGQARALRQLERGTLALSSLEGPASADLSGASPRLRRAVASAREATQDYLAWLRHEAPGKTGPSGVGKDNYSWYLHNVHLSPYGWEEEATLLRRELERAYASLRLEEHRNRALPPLDPVASAQDYAALARDRLDTFIAFLVDGGVIEDKPYLEAALRPRMGHYVAPQDREFFAQVTHREPMLLYAHDYHWFDLARMRDTPHESPIRRAPLLWNMWDTRAEGFATGFEELVMHAGLYDDNPRARELVWIMLASRAARGLASLYVHANEIGLEEAGRFQASWTPRNWAGAKDGLTAFEQLLYLRQPGYGTSYISGKLLVDRLLAAEMHRAQSTGQALPLAQLLEKIDQAGQVPVTVIESEVVGSRGMLEFDP